MSGRIAFVIAEDRQFTARGLPLLRAAQELRLEADVVTAVTGRAEMIERSGAGVLSVKANLASINPMTAGYAAGQVAARLKAARPDIVHCIGLGPALSGGAACVMAGIERRAYSLGPLGRLALPDDHLGWLGRRAVGSLLKGPLGSGRTRLVFETAADAELFGQGPGSIVLHGFGVDTDRVRPLPMPAAPPVKIAIVAPMSWGKGIDIAVEAVRIARLQRPEIELSLFDAPEGRRSQPFAPETLRGWAQRDGIHWHEAAPRAAADIWADHHVACLPSRGGEGTPYHLVKAAACGRPIVASDVPGCRELVTDGSEGFLVPPEDAPALAEAFVKLAADPVLLPTMGAAARARILHGYLERDITEAAKAFYSDMLGPGGRP